MAHFQHTTELAKRIQRIEQGLVPDTPTWCQDSKTRTLAECMAYYRTPGLSLAIINHGELEWAQGYGVLQAGSPEAVTPETIFQACSISKHVAMVATLRLVQDGLLDLDEDVNRYLVSWKVPGSGSWQPRIALRQLLGHTAGLTQNWYRGFRRGEAVPTLLQVLEGQSPANTPPVRVKLIPGSQFRYSGSHYSVLQQLLIDVTGKPFPELLQELVFEPLGMHHSSYDQEYPDQRPESTAVGHYIGGEPVYGKWRVIPEMAGAGLWTTAVDLARLACELYRAHVGKPTHILKKAVVDQALAPHIIESFGLGIELEGQGQSRRFGHSGDNIGYKCLSTTYVEHGMGAVVLTNADDGGWVAQELVRSIAQEYAWPDYLPNRLAATVDPQIYDAYVGDYEFHPGFSFTVSKGVAELFLEVPHQMPIALQPSSETTFFARTVNSEILFTKHEEGEVTGLVLKQEHRETSAKKVR
ncbi:MAG: serine hydrolase [Ktedonobacteraceae bacterium]|nr:serine hydrolase [Ktedonobacteraceae bacterium]